MSPTPNFDGMCLCPVSSPGRIKGLGQEETPVRSADLVFEERIPACNTHGGGRLLAPPAKYLQTPGRHLHSQHRTPSVSHSVIATTVVSECRPTTRDRFHPPALLQICRTAGTCLERTALGTASLDMCGWLG
uniref:Uncharacterized protein n=1 Tax=Piliocolobus tephrosceles TaxID=591936 RepID=A0A8C9LXI4_9PRIM